MPSYTIYYLKNAILLIYGIIASGCSLTAQKIFFSCFIPNFIFTLTLYQNISSFYVILASPHFIRVWTFCLPFLFCAPFKFGTTKYVGDTIKKRYKNYKLIMKPFQVSAIRYFTTCQYPTAIAVEYCQALK